MGAQLLLQRDELLRLLHEGDEEQPAQQGAADGVDAVGEGVAAPQDANAAVLLVAGQADVGVGRDDRLALVVLLVELRGRELTATGQRRPADLGPADDVLLVAAGSRGPSSR